MHLSSWLANLLEKVHEQFSCKNINKLRKRRMISDFKKASKPLSRELSDDWKCHDLSTIFEDCEPLCLDIHFSRPTSTTSTTSSTGTSLFEDPAILKLCYLDNSDPQRYHEKSFYDHRASSKIVISNIEQDQDIVQDMIALQAQEIAHLCTKLNRAQNELSHNTATLEHAHAELHFIRRENGTRFRQTQFLSAQVRHLERVDGWNTKKLKQRISDLAREMRGLELRVDMDDDFVEELQGCVREWRAYAEGLEWRVRMLEGYLGWA